MSDLTQDFQEFKAEEFVVKMKREPGCTVVLNIFVNPSATQAAYQKALKNLNKEFSFPGFRKGHAPAQIIEEKFSRQIEDEWKRVLAQTVSTEALKLVKVYPRTDKSVKKAEVKKISKQEGAELYFEYECKPEVPEIDLKNFELKPISTREITEKDVEDSLYKLRLEKGTYHTIEGRAVEEGDFVLVDIDALESQTPHKAVEGAFYQIGHSTTPAWINRLAIGLETGKSIDGELDCQDDDHTGHNHSVRLRLLEISTGKIADIQEEFLKSMGCENEETLRTRIKAQLEREEEGNRIGIANNQIDAFLLDQCIFDVPKSMYEHIAKDHSQRKVKDLQKQSSQQDTIETAKIQHEVEEDFKKAIRRYFITDKVARDHQLQVSEQEIQMEYLREVIMQQKTGKMNEDDVSRLYTKILHQKAMNCLRESIEKR